MSFRFLPLAACLVCRALATKPQALVLDDACAAADGGCALHALQTSGSAHKHLKTAPSNSPEEAGSAVESGAYFWPTQKGNANRTGVSQHPVLADISKQPPAWQWTDPEPGVIRATPLIDDKLNIYVSTVNGRVIKFSPEGKELWTYHSKHGAQPAVPALMDGKLFGNTKQGFMYALDMSTGDELWAVNVAPAAAGDTQSVFASDGLVLAAFSTTAKANNKILVAVSSDGVVKWQYTVPTFEVYNFQASSPGDGTLVFQDSSGGAYRLSMETGKPLWVSGIAERKTSWFSTAAAVVGPNDVVYCVSNYLLHGVVHAYALSDGTPLWRKNITLLGNQGAAVGKLAGSEGLSLVLGVGSQPGLPAGAVLPFATPISVNTPHQVLALDAETGETRWARDLSWYTGVSAKGDSERFVARKAAEAAGDIGDTICLPDCFAQAVISGDGTAYVGYQDGRLLGQGDANGDGHIDEESETWDHQFEDAFQASQAIAPGMLAVAPCGGGIWVWKTA